MELFMYLSETEAGNAKQPVIPITSEWIYQGSWGDKKCYQPMVAKVFKLFNLAVNRNARKYTIFF